MCLISTNKITKKVFRITICIISNYIFFVPKYMTNMKNMPQKTCTRLIFAIPLQ